MKLTRNIFKRGDFDYLSFTLFYFPDCQFTKKRDCIIDNDRGSEFSISAPTELIYLDTRFEDGEVYYIVFVVRLLGFGFALRRQTSY
jgi:hypothetical protein